VYASKSDGPLTPPDLKKLDDLVQGAAANEHTDLFQLVGSYLSRTGQQAEAIDFWKRCLRAKSNEPYSCSRTLAGAALRENGVPASETSPDSAAPDKSDETSTKEAAP